MVKQLSKARKRVTGWWQELQARLVLRVAIEKAERLHWANGVRYWVVPTPEGSLMVLNWAETVEYRKLGIFPKKMNVNGLYQIGFYWTDSKRKGNWGFMLRKGTIMKERYMSWWYATMDKRKKV